MAGPLMAPRSYDYSGEADPRDSRGFGVSMESAAPQGGFLSKLNEFAGKLAPFVEAAVAFKRGYQGYPLPGRGVDDSRMAGDRYIFEILKDMRTRNEQAEERAREEREAARKSGLREKIILSAMEQKLISPQEALRRLETGDVTFEEQEDKLPTQAPASGAP
jgi:hypothetical protein